MPPLANSLVVLGIRVLKKFFSWFANCRFCLFRLDLRRPDSLAAYWDFLCRREFSLRHHRSLQVPLLADVFKWSREELVVTPYEPELFQEYCCNTVVSLAPFFRPDGSFDFDAAVHAARYRKYKYIIAATNEYDERMRRQRFECAPPWVAPARLLRLCAFCGKVH